MWAAAPCRCGIAFPSIPTFTQAVVSASLRVYTFNIASTTGTETWQLREVNTSPSQLRAGWTNRTDIYTDLGDGPVYGSRVFSTNEAQRYIDVPLNATFLSALRPQGGVFAMGGEVISLDGTPYNDEYLFGYSNGGNGTNVELVINFAGSNPLEFVNQPQSQAVSAGSQVTFNAQACGTSVVSYQWTFNATNVPGANGPALTLFNVSSNDAGEYRVVVTNLSGSITSSIANLSVIYRPPLVTSYFTMGGSPAYVGNDVTLCANVDGWPFPSLQWRKDGTNLPGQTAQCLYLSGVQTNQSGDYTIVASNVLGVATSAVVNLEIKEPPPVYAYYPYESPPFAVGSYAYICAMANISPYPTFQWALNGTNLTGQTNSCLYVSLPDASSAGLYAVVASNISGVSFPTSPPLALTVYFRPLVAPSIGFTLGSASALLGNDVTMCAYGGGSPPFSYQWRFNDTDLLGANASCLSMLAIGTNQAGNYSVVISNPVSVVTSAVVSLTVSSQPPVFVGQPYSQEIVEGATVTLGAFAEAGPPATHTLQHNGVNVPVPFSYFGTFGGGFTLLDVSLADAGSYQVIASNAFGMATSIVANLTVDPAGPLDRWTQRNPLPESQPLYGIAYGSGLYVAAGERGTILTSTNGTNWFLQARRVDLQLQGIAFGTGAFVAVGDLGTILSSGNGTNWTYRYTAPAATLRAVTYANGRFVAVGDGPGQTFALVSTNGADWDRTTVPGIYANRAVAFGNGIFVAAGSGNIMISTNGLDWIVTRSGLSSEIEGITFAQNQFIAVGDNGLMLGSADGMSWTTRNSGVTRRLLGVTYSAGKFIAVGVRGMIITSSDALTWSAVVSGTPDRLETVMFGNGLFIAAGENGTIITSPTGSGWGKQNSGPTRDLDGMALANGTAVIVGKAGTILTSTDGAHYTEQNAGLTNDLHGVGWGSGLWVVVGEPGIILTSPNAVQWTRRESGNTNSLKSAGYGAGKWVVAFPFAELRSQRRDLWERSLRHRGRWFAQPGRLLFCFHDEWRLDVAELSVQQKPARHHVYKRHVCYGGE